MMMMKLTARRSRCVVTRETISVSPGAKALTRTHTARRIVHLTINSTKTEADVHKEIQAVIRQITASVTFLPLLEEKCTFNLLVYANKHADVPTEWVDSDPLYIPNAEQVRLRSFSTGVHKMDTIVCYKYDDELGGSLC